MDMSSKTSLHEIPKSVFDLGVFPCLRLKDLLRLRRVCKFTKGLSEDYLRKHPDSSNCIQIFNEKDAGDTRSLESFLLQDGANSIRKPTRTLKLFFSKDQKIFGHPGLPEFLEKYGSQIESLHVSYLSIPMGEDEWRFYEGLPKLKSLMFEFHVAPDLASDAVIAFPGTFKNLTTFKVLGSGQADISKFYWTLVDHCTNLETIDFDGTLYSGPHHLKELLRILEQKAHKNLKFCMIWLYFYIEFADPSTSNSQLLPLCEKYKLKFTGFHVNKLSAFEKSRRQVISEAISTLLWRPGENCELSEDTPLPNVEKIYMCMKSKFLPLINKGSGQFVDAAAGENLRRSLSPVIFPNLKKLEVGLCDRLSDPSVMTHMWGWLPNLEEIVFGSTKCLKNVFFLGFKKELPFLLLTKLKKLELHDPASGLTDTVFRKVFMQMRLREFRIFSSLPLTTITSAGISSLLNGPFRETIEIFPFHGWSLAGVDNDGFQQLARKFPCNKPL